jgi:hypothetical protein
MLYIPPINETLLAGKIKTRNIVWQEKTKYLYTSPKINIVRWKKGKTVYCLQETKLLLAGEKPNIVGKK